MIDVFSYSPSLPLSFSSSRFYFTRPATFYCTHVTCEAFVCVCVCARLFATISDFSVKDGRDEVWDGNGKQSSNAKCAPTDAENQRINPDALAGDTNVNLHTV